MKKPPMINIHSTTSSIAPSPSRRRLRTRHRRITSALQTLLDFRPVFDVRYVILDSLDDDVGADGERCGIDGTRGQDALFSTHLERHLSVNTLADRFGHPRQVTLKHVPLVVNLVLGSYRPPLPHEIRRGDGGDCRDYCGHERPCHDGADLPSR